MLNLETIRLKRRLEFALRTSVWLLICSAPVSAFDQPLTPVVCHCSGAHDQCDSTLPRFVGASELNVLELCLDLAPEALVPSSHPTEACSRTNPGNGNEICAWQVSLVTDQEMSISDYVEPPDAIPPMRNIVVGMESTGVRFNRVTAAIGGESGVVYLGEISIATTAQCDGCDLRVSAPGSMAYDADSTLHAIEPSVIAVPEPRVHALLLCGTGLLALLCAHRHRRAKSTQRPAARLATTAMLLLPTGLLIAGSPVQAQLVELDGSLVRSDFGSLPAGGQWDRVICRLGDVDGDGLEDFAVGNPGLDPGSTGGVRIVFPYLDGTIKRSQLISDGLGGFTGSISPGSFFGNAITSLGDLNGDGVNDIAVGSAGSTDVWILYLNSDGTVQSHIGHSVNASYPTTALASLGDVNLNGVTDLAVGMAQAPCSEMGGPLRCGQVDVLYLNSGGGIDSTVTIDASDVSGLIADSGLGASLAALGDIDGDNTPDFAAGAPGIGSPVQGEVAVIRLLPGGTVLSSTNLVTGGIGWAGATPISANFGASLTAIGDIDGNGVTDLAVGAPGMAGVTQRNGAVFLVNLDFAGASLAIVGNQEILYGEPGLPGVFTINSEFGVAVDVMDTDSDGRDELWVGATTSLAAVDGVFWSLELIDSDDDGVVDYADNCPNDRNSLQHDADADGVGDTCDNCSKIHNSAQTNSNGGHYGDACEPPVVRLRALWDVASPTWQLEVECNSATISQLAVGIMMSDEVDHSSVVVGGGCEEPPPPLGPGGGSGCEFGDPGKIGAAVDIFGSGIFYDPSATNGQRQDTIYAVFKGSGYTGGQLLCEPGYTEDIVEIEIDGGPTYATYPHFTLTTNGMNQTYLGYDYIFEGLLGSPVSAYSAEYQGETETAVHLELNVVAGQPGQYQVCFKAEDHMKRISIGLEPPYLPNGVERASIDFIGCETSADPNVGTFSCDPTLMPSYVDTGNSFTIHPTPAYAAPNSLNPDRLYAVFEGKLPLLPFPPGLNADLGVGPNIGATCLGVVQVSGGSTDPPIFYVDNALEDLPFRTTPAGAFMTNLDSQVVDEWITAIQFGLDDVDRDSISDETDNCTYTQNTMQQNTGDLHTLPPVSIGLGDACECGSEETVNGHIIPGDADLDEIQKVLAGLPTADPDAGDRCSVDGNQSCELSDALLLDQALSDVGVSLIPSCRAANDL